MADSSAPLAPLDRKSLMTRVILYAVSTSVWALLALYGHGRLLRICGAVVCVINVTMVAGYIRRYRELGPTKMAK